MRLTLSAYLPEGLANLKLRNNLIPARTSASMPLPGVSRPQLGRCWNAHPVMKRSKLPDKLSNAALACSADWQGGKALALRRPFEAAGRKLEKAVEIVVGTGGESHYAFDANTAANSVIRNSSTFGVLQLTLHATSYSWQFVPVAGQTFTDSGTQACHIGA